jgi:hypothetical protein
MNQHNFSVSKGCSSLYIFTCDTRVQDSDGKASGLGVSPVSTPESGFRSVLSVENLCSEQEDMRATPYYPTRKKTREEFL